MTATTHIGCAAGAGWWVRAGLEPADERARASQTTRAVLVGVRIVRPVSSTHTVRHSAGLPPTLAELLELSSQRTGPPLGSGCHCKHPLRMDVSKLRPRPAFATTGVNYPEVLSTAAEN